MAIILTSVIRPFRQESRNVQSSDPEMRSDARQAESPHQVERRVHIPLRVHLTWVPAHDPLNSYSAHVYGRFVHSGLQGLWGFMEAYRK